MLVQIAQHVEDRPRATAFYRDVVGVPLLGEFDPPGLSFFDLGGGMRLLLEAGASPALLYLGVADVAATRAAMERAGVTFEGDIHRIYVHDGELGQLAGTEEWMTFFRDSEGNLVGLCELRRST